MATFETPGAASEMVTAVRQRRRSPLGLFAEHPAPRLYDRIVRAFLGHSGVKTTMIYTHVLNRGGKGVKSPVDDL